MFYTKAIFRAGYGAGAVEISVPLEHACMLHDAEPVDHRGYRFKLCKVSGEYGESFARIRYAEGIARGVDIQNPKPPKIAEALKAAVQWPKTWDQAVGEFKAPDVSVPGTPSIRRVMEPDGITFRDVMPASPATKFKPGDRVYWDDTRSGGGRERHYREVARVAKRLVWFTNGRKMPESRVFADLRTIAGGGVLKLETGRRGRSRDGRIFGPIVPTSNNLLYPWKALQGSGNEMTFTSEGRFYSDYGPADDFRDIIELLPA